MSKEDFEITHPEFCEWFDGIESYSSRAERLYEDFPDVKNLKLLRAWMEAAFNAGYLAGNIKQPKVYVDVEV